MWRERTGDMRHHALPGGHYLPEELPHDVVNLLREFFADE
jgi:surfactin synthase thioesterase subunit